MDEGGVLPQLPIQVDSPLGRSFSLVYRDYPDELATPEPKNSNVDWLVDPEEAFQASKSRGTSVIIASGGMLEGARSSSIFATTLTTPGRPWSWSVFRLPELWGKRCLKSIRPNLSWPNMEQMARCPRSFRLFRARRSTGSLPGDDAARGKTGDR